VHIRGKLLKLSEENNEVKDECWMKCSKSGTNFNRHLRYPLKERALTCQQYRTGRGGEGDVVDFLARIS